MKNPGRRSSPQTAALSQLNCKGYRWHRLRVKQKFAAKKKVTKATQPTTETAKKALYERCPGQHFRCPDFCCANISH